MATVRPYINHLLQNIGITPACSEEERAAAEDIAHIFARHGFEPEMQEFSASASKKTVSAVLGIAVFLGAVLMGIGGVIGIIGLVLAIAAAALFVLERTGRPVLSKIGSGGLSQNVIAYHKASGPLASPRNRPVVVVAHYDSPRADLFSQMPYASYRPIIVKLLPYAMLVPAIVAVLRVFPFPDAAKVVLWILAILAALVPLAQAVAIIMNRYVLPYTSGAVCNKSSVAAMLGIMNAVAPFHGENEFPHDIPFEEYFAEQRRAAEEAARAAEAAAMAAAGETYTEEEFAAEGTETALAPDETAPMDVLDETASVVAPDATATMTAVTDETLAGTGVLSSAPAVEVDEDAGSEYQVPARSADETQAMSAQDFAAALGAEFEVIDGSGAVASAEPSSHAGEEASVAEEEPPSAVPTPSDDAAAADDEASDEETPQLINAAGNIRFGEEAIRGLGMLPASCVIEYEVPAPATPASRPMESTAAAATATSEVDATEATLSEQVVDDAAGTDFDMLSDTSDDEPFVDEVDEDDAFSADYDENAYRGSYESEGLDFSAPVPAVRPATGYARGSFVDTLSAVGERAAGLFGRAIERGKNAIEEFKASRAAAQDEEELVDDAPEGFAYHEEPGIEPLPMDATATFNPLEQGDEDATSDEAAADMDATVEAAPLVDDTLPASEALDHVDEDAALDSENNEGGDQVAATDDEDAFWADDPSASDAGQLDLGSTIAAPALEAHAAEDAVSVEGARDEQAPRNMDASPQRSGQPSVDLGATVAQQRIPDPATTPGDRPVETVDALMAEISAPRPTQARRAPLVVPDPAQPSLYQPSTTSRSALFDLPDPAVTPTDPFAPESAAPASASQAPARSLDAVPAVGDVSTVSPTPSNNGFTVISSPAPANPPAEQEAFGTISADAPIAGGYRAEEPKRRGIGGLFHRSKRTESSMSEYLGVDDNFDAKRSGRDIGSWDNFEDDFDDWKGGATGIESVTASELRDAITSLGDDELLGHDIWFVATGASEYDNAGMKAFLQTHRDKLRGVFLINLECVGAGQVAMLATEGDKRVLKGDKRIMNLVSKVSAAFHNEYGAIDMPYVKTDAYAAMSMSLRSLTLAGIDGPRIACSHSEEDVPYNVDVDNIERVADVVTEVIRRS